MKNNQSKTKLLMPAFLKYDPGYFDFNFVKEDESQKQEQIKLNMFKQNLLLKYGKKNTIILLDGNVIYKNFNKEKLQIFFDKKNKCLAKYLNKETNDFLTYENKKHLNSHLIILVKGRKQKLNIILALTKQIYHFTLINADKDTCSDIFEKVVGIDKAKINHVLKINAKDNASVSYNNFYDVKSALSQAFTQKLTTAVNSNINFNLLNLSSCNVMNITYGYMKGQGGVIKNTSCCFANNNIFKSLTKIMHEAKNTSSEIDNLAIANNFAKIETDSIGQIKKGFENSNAMQKSNFVLLDSNSKAITNPQLLIDENNVSAGHSASVGRLDKQQIYYLQSRGLKKEVAKQTLILALAEKSLKLLPSYERVKALKLLKEKIK